MTRAELLRRLKLIKGRPLNRKSEPRVEPRREVNKVENKDEFDVSEFDTFFDYEEEIAGLESARQQMEKLQEKEIKEQNSYNPESETFKEEESFVKIEEFEVPEPTGFIQLEEKSDKENNNFDNNRDDSESNNQDDEKEASSMDKEKSPIINPDFCHYIKSNDEQCKRRHPKDSEYCGTHRKMLDNQ